MTRVVILSLIGPLFYITFRYNRLEVLSHVLLPKWLTRYTKIYSHCCL
jgi:hypothetical protein